MILWDMIDKRQIVVYLDDISISTETFEEQLEILDQVLQSLSTAGKMQICI